MKLDTFFSVFLSKSPLTDVSVVESFGPTSATGYWRVLSSLRTLASFYFCISEVTEDSPKFLVSELYWMTLDFFLSLTQMKTSTSFCFEKSTSFLKMFRLF